MAVALAASNSVVCVDSKVSSCHHHYIAICMHFFKKNHRVMRGGMLYEVGTTSGIGKPHNGQSARVCTDHGYGTTCTCTCKRTQMKHIVIYS